jgi:hypothetical protein
MSSSGPARSRPHSVYVRLDQAEHQAISAAATAAGISNAAFVRRQALAAIGAPEITPARRGGTALPSADLDAISDLSGKLGLAAGATIQLAKSLRERGVSDLHGQTEAVLADLRRQVSVVAAIVHRMT